MSPPKPSDSDNPSRPADWRRLRNSRFGLVWFVNSCSRWLVGLAFLRGIFQPHEKRIIWEVASVHGMDDVTLVQQSDDSIG